MSRYQKFRDFSVQTCLLFLVVLYLTACSSITTTEREIVPVDNGMGVPGIVVIHDYDEDSGRFRGLLLQVGGDTIVFIPEKDVSGAALIPRNRVVELLSKEAALSKLLSAHPELIDESLDLLREETKRLKEKVAQ